jgi:hypothetical protein
MKTMKELLGVKYITQKEASTRYGMSTQWFERARHTGDGPPYFKIRGKGIAYYDVEKTDFWFKANMIEGE